MIRIFTKSVLLSCALVSACSGSGSGDPGERLNIGETRVLGASLSDYVATWEGYAQLHEFGKGEGDVVTLSLDANGDGYVRVGAHELYEPATNALSRWPTEDGLPSYNVMPAGFLHAFAGARVSARRLQLQVSVQPMDSWCALQTSYPQEGASGYNCLPNYAFSRVENECYAGPEGETGEPISCAQMEDCLRGRVCSCDTHGCAGATDLVGLDAVLEDDGQTLKGTLSGVTVILYRVD